MHGVRRPCSSVDKSPFIWYTHRRFGGILEAPKLLWCEWSHNLGDDQLKSAVDLVFGRLQIG